ncbi:protein-disulfide reductase DsbD domain-containing protein [Pararhodobacter sp.]|uniref:protein-disulfide reductase DsbD domain-containing protein n=1 Tax=Pararhodobacter sp. TaxID=2127056 RepID=UPI002FDCB032
MKDICPPFSAALCATLRGFALGAAVLSAPGIMALTSAPAQAQRLSQAQLVQAELRPGWRTERGTHMAALHLRLADGWKTYWRIPGEAGIAPQLDWSQSQNVASVTAHWPRPIVFDQNGYRSIGYAGELVLPLEFTPRRDGRPMALIAEVTIGVCRDTCVPVDLTLTLPLRDAGAHDPLIAAALAQRPEAGTGAGLTRATCRVEPGARGVELTLRASLPRLGPQEHMVMELPGTGYWVSDSETWREGSELVGRARVRAPQQAAVSIERGAVAFTIISGDRMVTHRGCTGG